MALEPGRQLGHYEITDQIGKGGMGEVYRARDTRLGREVAVKVLPSEFSQDAERLARFEREAKLLASLNHPNIAAIYGLEESEDTRFLVLELVEGDTLADRLRQGAIPVEESLKLGLQIAEALEAAHEKGVVHRDLKPANIKVTPDGKAKVLDFGLAKALTGDTPGSNLSQSPTLSMAATAQGIILGTAAYMSPEQARGVSVDKRADIWAFGCILYEMLTGRQVFGGELMSDVMASVLKSDPNYQELPPSAPPRLRALLQRCLQKDPKQRWHDVSDLRLDLEAVLSEPFDPTMVPSGAPGRQARLLWGAAVAAALIVGWGGATIWRDGDINDSGGITELVRFPLMPPEDVRIYPGTQTPVVVSPDGNRVAIVGQGDDGIRRIWVRDMDDSQFSLLDGTDGAAEVFWHPDSQTVGFITDTGMFRVFLPGGAVRVITTGSGMSHGEWGRDDTILFSTDQEIHSIRANGSDAVVLTDARETGAANWPRFLDDGLRFIYSAPGEGIILDSIDGEEPRVLLPRSFDQRSSIFLVPGYLLYVEDHVLRARRFDQETLELGDESFPVLDGIPTWGRGVSPVSISDNGVTAYWPRPVGEFTQLQWFDRSGVPGERVGQREIYSGFSLSPDANRIAFSRVESTGARNLWTRDAEGRETKLTVDGDSSVPIWSPDGTMLAFQSARQMPPNLFLISATGGDADRLTEAPNVTTPGSWTSDQDEIVFTAGYGRISAPEGEIRAFDLETESDSAISFNSPGGGTQPRLSLDDRWLAYVYDGSGQSEVWLAGYPDGQGRQVGPGGFPVWAEDELLYLSDDAQIMSLPFDTDGEDPGAAVANALFPVSNIAEPSEVGASVFQVTQDGERFLISVQAEEVDEPAITVILNWTELLEE